MAARSLRGGCDAQCEQREKDAFALSCPDPEQQGDEKGKAQMMLFSDESGRLYLIFVDVNRKATWVPLSSSFPGRRGTLATAEKAEERDTSLSELKTASQTRENGFRREPLTPGTSADDVAEDQRARRVETSLLERISLKGVSACGQTLSPSYPGSG